MITSRWDLGDVEVAYRMFERWRQENFFKYMREEFLLDALVDYQIEPEDPTRTIPNPERRALDKDIRTARADLARLECEYGAAAANNAERHRPTMRGFKIAHGSLGKQLREARARVMRLLDQRRDVPKRAEVRELNDRAVVKLATERKHLTDIIKMVAYQAESDLVALLRPHYARVDQEGRTLLHELFATAGDIRVSDSELHITLAPLSSPHRTLAAQALCQTLDQTATIFPGSPGPAQQRHGCCHGSLIDAEAGHFALRYVRRSEIAVSVMTTPPPCRTGSPCGTISVACAKTGSENANLSSFPCGASLRDTR